MSWWKIVLIVLAVLITGGIGVAWYVINYAEIDIYVPLFADNCGSCHGEDLQGTDRGVALLATSLQHGDDVAAMVRSIRDLHPESGRPAFAQLSDVEVKGLAIYVGERRLGQRFMDFKYDREVLVPAMVQRSEAHDFVVETFVTDLEPLIFSIAPLPDGSWLVTEKERGISIISADGVQSEPIKGTPETGGSIDIMGVQYGSGWLLDIAAHPDYADNGWLYLHYTHLCGDDCSSLAPYSMNRVDRGRIRDGAWVDVETIWQAPREYYQPTPDTGAGGRLAFDDEGHVYFSVGIKGTDGTSDTTAQDLLNPYGKIHRVRDDGSIPLDNPFLSGEPAQTSEHDYVRQSIWTYGHRSPQGLEWHPLRKRVWDSEMGPRGGDELNELIGGHNYGWPFFSLGLEYSGTHVERHKPKALEFDPDDIEQTLVDITPSPAISSFAFYTGDAFPQWRNDVLIGSLKGSSLFRMVFEGNQFQHQETLIKDLARIRDVEIGYDGFVYLLLEAKSGGSIVRLVPR